MKRWQNGFCTVFYPEKFLITNFFFTDHKSVLPNKIKTAHKYGPYMYVYHYPIKADLKFIQILTNTVSEAYLESKCWWWGTLRAVAWRWRAKNDWPCPELSAAKRLSTASRCRNKPWNVYFRIVMHYHQHYFYWHSLCLLALQFISKDISGIKKIITVFYISKTI
jgi:hypothetical protein